MATTQYERTADQLAEWWSLTLGEPYEPGATASWVAPATTAAGDQLVLKVGRSHDEAQDEAAGLRIWDGAGAVRLHGEWREGHTVALLVERCVPGTPLGEVLPEPEQDLVVAGLLRRLWREPPARPPLRPLAQMCDAWVAEFEAGHAADPCGLEPALVRDAMTSFRELPRPSGDAVVLCTDLHAGNVLAAEREPWLAIDPKPYVGDRTYDVVQHLLNCTERLRADPGALVRRFAGLLDLDAARLRQWLLARCVQGSLDDPDLADVARALA